MPRKLAKAAILQFISLTKLAWNLLKSQLMVLTDATRNMESREWNEYHCCEVRPCRKTISNHLLTQLSNLKAKIKCMIIIISAKSPGASIPSKNTSTDTIKITSSADVAHKEFETQCTKHQTVQDTHREILVSLTDDWFHPYWREIKKKDQRIIKQKEVTKLVFSCKFTYDGEGSSDMSSIKTHIRDWTPEL